MSAQSNPEDPADVQSYKDEYPVRKHDDVYRYRVTIPRQMFDDAGVEDRDQLGVTLDTGQDGYATIVYTTASEDAALQFTASKHSSGELSVPSALGATLDIEDTSVRWERVEREDGKYDFRAITETRLPQVDTSQATPLESKPLKHVTQDVEWEGDEWQQEHFQLYLTVENVEALQWDDDAHVGIRLVRVNGIPSVLITPDTDALDPKAVKTIRSTGEKQSDRILYVPNDIVRSLGLVERELAWVNLDDTLVLVPMN